MNNTHVLRFSHRFRYHYDEIEASTIEPRLIFTIENPQRPDLGQQDIQAKIDSGAEYTLFKGWVLQLLDVELMDGESRKFQSLVGESFTGWKHEVKLLLTNDLQITMNVYFSDANRRNVIGRDFFDSFRIGFDQINELFYLAQYGSS